MQAGNGNKGTQNAMEWPQIIGVTSTAIVGAQGMLKLYQRFKFLTRSETPPKGVTIMNGEAKDLFAAIRRIESKQDRHGHQMETLTERVTGVEERLSAMS